MLLLGSTKAMSKLLVGSKVVQGLTVVLVPSLIRDKGRGGVVIENFRGCGGGDGDQGWPGKVVQG